MKNKIKYIKPNKDYLLLLDLEYIVLRDTNSKLISLAIHRLCKKFIKELKETPLSEELQ